MKNVLFDLLMAQAKNGNTSGGFEFVYAVFKELAKYHKKEINLIVFYDFRIGLESWITELIRNEEIKSYDLKDLHEIKQICKEEKVDVFYSGMPYQYTFPFANEHVVCIGTFHGLRSFEAPEDEYVYKYYNHTRGKIILRKIFRQWNQIPVIKGRRIEKQRKASREKYWKAMSNFDKITCVSYHSKYAIEALYGEKIPPVSVFYSPEKVRTLNKQILDKHYILLTMCDRFRKNVYRALVAINNLQKSGLLPEIKTIVTGKPSNIMKEEFANNKAIEFLEGYVSNEKLEQLYAECSLFVFPSINEGFGYPPLEAMAYGKTCVVGADTSIPEICGDAVYYVNPYDVFEMQTRILEALKKPIEPEKVKSRYQKVNERQKKDLKKLCEFIANS